MIANVCLRNSLFFRYVLNGGAICMELLTPQASSHLMYSYKISQSINNTFLVTIRHNGNDAMDSKRQGQPIWLIHGLVILKYRHLHYIRFRANGYCTRLDMTAFSCTAYLYLCVKHDERRKSSSLSLSSSSPFIGQRKAVTYQNR